MRHASLRTFALSGSAAILALSASVSAPRAASPEAPSVREFKVPHPVTKTLANGLVVHVFEDHDLPAVYYRLLIKGGASDESADKAGLASLTAQVMRQGTQTLSAQELSKKIDFVGGQLDLQADRNFTLAQAQVRTVDRDLGLDLLADVALHPAFLQEEVDRIKSQTQAGIRQSRDDPGSVADEHLRALVHGSHPYARPISGDEQSVGGLNRADLVAFHESYWKPNNAILAVAGDVKPDEAFAAVERAFGSWQKGDVPQRPQVESPSLSANKVRLLDKPDLTQSQIRIGYVGLPRTTPDYYAVQVMNYIVGGGGFASRLTARVRAKAGLTYDISTGFTYGVDPDLFSLETFTKNESVKAAIDASLAVIDQYRQEGPTADELAKAKSFYLGVFPFGFQGPGDLATQWLRAEFFGLGDDYFDRYRERIRAVTVADVRRVAQQYLHTTPAVIVVVGRAADVESQLTGYGTLDKKSFLDRSGAIPEVAPTAPTSHAEATPESRAKAAAVVAKAVAAHGGAVNLKAVRTWHTRGNLELTMGPSSVEGQYAEFVQMPSKRRMEMTILGEAMVQVMNGDSAWASRSGQTAPMSPDQVEAMRVGGYSNPLRLLLALSEPGADIRYAGSETVDENPAEIVEWIRPGGNPARVFFDAKSGLLVQVRQPELSPAGGGWVAVRRAYSDYRTVGKLKYPFKVTVYSAGTKAVEQTLSQFEVNQGVTESLFRRPSQ